MVSPDISIRGLPLPQYIYFTSLGNAAWLNIFYIFVAALILPVMVYFTIYILIALEISSTAINKFGRRLSYGGCVTGPIFGLKFPDPELGHDVGNGSLEMSSNISGFNEVLKCRLLMLR